MRIRGIALVLVFLVLTIQLSLVFATNTDGTSSSPPDEWWMYGNYNNFTRYTNANTPANISNTTVNTYTFTTSSTSAPILVEDSVYVNPAYYWTNTARFYRLNATNVSQLLDQSSSSYYQYTRDSPTYFNGSIYFLSYSGSRYFNFR